jgi:hypothetical protein
MGNFAELPQPPPLGDRHLELVVTVYFRSTSCSGRMRISSDGVVVRLGRIMQWVVGARSLTHALPTLAVETTHAFHPMRQWMLVEAAEGSRAAVRTRASLDQLRDLAALADVQTVLAGPGLRDQATKMLERPRPSRKDL